MKPIPPWICCAMRTAIRHFSLANALACDTSTLAGRPNARREIASRTSSCAPSTPIVMSAAMCWIAWNEPIGCPNALRCLA